MSPYDEGFEAAKNGDSFLSNPYEEGSEAWEEWCDGFTDGQE